MRRVSGPIFGLMVAVLSVAGPASSWGATELEALRDDLRRTQEDFRKLLELQQQTQRRMEELQKKMEAVESAARAQAAPPPSAPVPPTTAPAAAAPPSPVPPGRLGLNVAGRPILFDLGISTDIVGSLSSARDPLQGRRPTFIGRENRIFPREIDLALSGSVDPYIRADVFLEFSEEGEIEDGQVRRSLGAGIEEAYLTTLSLPYGLQVRGGRLRPVFGLLSHLHAHALPQVDAPNVLTNFLGEERLRENGVEVSWAAPLPFYLELRSGVFNGDNEVSFGRGSIRNPLVVTRLKSFFELADEHALQLGISGATGPNNEAAHGTRTVLAGADFKYKWKPLDKPYRQFILAGEYLFSHRRREPEVAVDLGLGDGSFVLSRDERHLNRHGFYVYGDYQLDRRWFVGTRVDWSQFPGDPAISPQEARRGAREWALSPYMTFRVSDFFLLRAQYKRTFRNFAQNADEVFLQASFALGTHPPHPW